jgi:hypothetical protein
MALHLVWTDIRRSLSAFIGAVSDRRRFDGEGIQIRPVADIPLPAESQVGISIRMQQPAKMIFSYPLVL